MLKFTTPSITCPKCKEKMQKQITRRRDTYQTVIQLSCKCGLGVALSTSRLENNTAEAARELVETARQLLGQSLDIEEGK